MERLRESGGIDFMTDFMTDTAGEHDLKFRDMSCTAVEVDAGETSQELYVES